MNGAVWAIAGLGLLFRMALSWATSVPAEDGANYLWMAQRFAAGDFTTPIQEVFPPLGPLLMAIPMASGIDPLRAGQGVMALAGAWSVWAVARATQQVMPAAAIPAAWMIAFAPLLSRYGAECYSEPLFVALIGMATTQGLRGRAWHSGVWAGVAFWSRPEALVVPLALAISRAAPRMLWGYLPLGLAVAALTCWRGLATGDFHPLPKLVFNFDRGLEESWAWGHNVLAIPLAAVEAYGPVLLLAVIGLVRPPGKVGARGLAVSWVVAMGPVVTFAVRRRFLGAWMGWVVPCAAVAVASWSFRVRAAILGGLAVYGVAVGWRGLTDESRVAERDLGVWLQRSLGPGDEIVSDMTRVRWFAGLRPLPPRHFTADQLLAESARATVRYGVFSARRETWSALERELSSWSSAPLPPGLAAQVAARGMVVRVKP